MSTETASNLLTIVKKVYNKSIYIVSRVLTPQRLRSCLTSTGYFLNQCGICLMVLGRRIVRRINRHITDQTSDSFVVGLGDLHRRIAGILRKQKHEYEHYSYFSGYPYQSLGILGVYGERASEERFDSYGLADIIGKNDYVLDIGCNCGFMAILTSYRTGARTHGIDINPYMTDIGTECAEFLKIGDKVDLEGKRFQDLSGENIYSVVFSFATHWTDDGNYRVGLKEHLMKIHTLLQPQGTLVFETHCSDVGDASFYQTMEEMREHFSWEGFIKTDNALRELYVMKKK